MQYLGRILRATRKEIIRKEDRRGDLLSKVIAAISIVLNSADPGAFRHVEQDAFVGALGFCLLMAFPYHIGTQCKQNQITPQSLHCGEKRPLLNHTRILTCI